MNKINLVIASYAGINKWSKQRLTYSFNNKTLYYNIKNLNIVKHNVNQITLMKAIDDRPTLESYYDLPNVSYNLKIHEIKNEHYSMSQFIKAYEIYTTKFDYYIFLEDDYTPIVDNFDKIIISIYKKKFPNNIGVLANIVIGKKYFGESCKFADHWDGVMIVSRETLEQVKTHFNTSLSNTYEMLLEKSYKNKPKSGGRCQMIFSNMFTKANIMHKSMLSEYPFIFNDSKQNYHICNDDNKARIFIKKCKYKYVNTINQSIIIPLQLLRRAVIILSVNTNIHNICKNKLLKLNVKYSNSFTPFLI